jgi:hypothetical protein
METVAVMSKALLPILTYRNKSLLIKKSISFFSVNDQTNLLCIISTNLPNLNGDSRVWKQRAIGLILSYKLKNHGGNSQNFLSKLV